MPARIASLWPRANRTHRQVAGTKLRPLVPLEWCGSPCDSLLKSSNLCCLILVKVNSGKGGVVALICTLMAKIEANEAIFN